MKKKCCIRPVIVSALLFSIILFLSCASADSRSFRRDKDFFYGTGSGPTQEVAAENAKVSLISSAINSPVTVEMAKSFPLKKLRPYIKEKKSDSVSIVYRISAAEWAKMEIPREARLREELSNAFAQISGSSQQQVVLRLRETSNLLSRLWEEGLYPVLTESEGGDIIFSETLLKYSKNLLTSIQVAIQENERFISDGAILKASFLSEDGSPVVDLPVAVMWKSEGMATPAALAVTDSLGSLTVGFPYDESIRNRSVTLVLSPLPSAMGGEAAFLERAELSQEREFVFRHFENVQEFFTNDVRIPGGEFTAGAVTQDTRSESIEKPRAVILEDFYIDRYPVTNEMFRVYLEDSALPREAYPDFWDNKEYNKPDQPVIGVSWKDVDGFVSWLDSRLGIRKRLPNEDEWEKAAHGGIDGIYPWGDRPPDEPLAANFNGNGLFDSTSPVGSFIDGVNAYGLFDMAGNVREWTSTPLDDPDAQDAILVAVKGGSWMDGPADIRVSARRFIDPFNRYVDVGFRLVRGVSYE